jgi:hypothetical protein
MVKMQPGRLATAGECCELAVCLGANWMLDAWHIILANVSRSSLMNLGPRRLRPGGIHKLDRRSKFTAYVHVC